MWTLEVGRLGRWDLRRLGLGGRDVGTLGGRDVGTLARWDVGALGRALGRWEDGKLGGELGLEVGVRCQVGFGRLVSRFEGLRV